MISNQHPPEKMMFQLTLRRRGISDQAVLRTMEEVPREQTFAMSCGHRFCTQAEGGGLSCWHGHVENSLKSAGSAMAALCCPAAGCAQLVGPEEIERFGSARREPSAADTRGAA